VAENTPLNDVDWADELEMLTRRNGASTGARVREYLTTRAEQLARQAGEVRHAAAEVEAERAAVRREAAAVAREQQQVRREWLRVTWAWALLVITTVLLGAAWPALLAGADWAWRVGR